MIRLAARQFRAQAMVAAGSLVIVAIVLTITGRDLIHLYNVSGMRTCQARGDCGLVSDIFSGHYQALQSLTFVVVLLPAIIGIFWGAPLVARELETGTYRLVWTQSVSRSRWLAVKLGMVGLASIAVAGLFSFMVTWWFSPIDRASANQFGTFDSRDIVAVGYAAFAFAFGVAAGTVIRRTLPAMGTTLVGFAGGRLAVRYWLRPHLMAPAHISAPLASASQLGFQQTPTGLTFVAGVPNIPNSWVYSDQIANRAGQVQSQQALHTFLVKNCPTIVTPTPPGLRREVVRGPGDPAVFNACIRHLSAKFHEAVAYQPAGRYWTFQWYETAIYLALALILIGFCFWWLRRRLI